MADTTYQSKIYRKQGGEELVVADGGIIRIESGGSLISESGSVLSLPDLSVEVGDLALADARIIVGNSSGKAVAVVPAGDVTITNAGVTAIGAKKVLDTMISATPGTVLVGTKTDLDVTLLDNSAAGSLVIGQGAGETCAAHTLSGDVTMDATGAVTIAAGAVESAMLANGAGVAALLTAGLGGSVSVTKTDAATTTIVAAHDTKDRACLVLVVVDETYDVGTGTLPTVKIGEDDTIEKCMAGTVLDNEAAGTVLAFAFTNTAEKKIIVTTTAAEGNATGGCSITVLAIPTT